MLVGNLSINIRCGLGGSGSIDFKDNIEKTKPIGGSGGDGGSVFLEVSNLVHDLSHINSKKLIEAENGGDGGKNYKKGEKGKDTVIKVPPGTRVMTKEKEIIADLINLDSTFVLSEGGKGGRGNSDLFSKKNISPKFAESGEITYKQEYIFDLALISDVAIVGLPNVGKSSLLRSITNSKAVVADYPFTTKTPNIGILTETNTKLRIVDLPGLIGQASKGKGLGKEILKHLTGTRIILYVLDPSPIQENTIEEQLNILDEEIINYDKNINNIQKIVIVNKIDLFKDTMFDNCLNISCKEGKGIDRLLNEISNVFSNNKLSLSEVRTHFELKKPKFSSHYIEKLDGSWMVGGTEVDMMCNLIGNSEEVGNEIIRRFEESGIEDELKSKGINNGDIIMLGSQEFVFSE
jgi:GTP-binding protein